MSCANVLDNDTTLETPTFTGGHTCAIANMPCCWNQNRSATATQTLRFKPDGTWEVVNYASNPSATTVLASGNWITGTFNPADYEIRMTGDKKVWLGQWPNGQWGSSDICRGSLGGPPTLGSDVPVDTGWLPLSSMREINATYTVSNQWICVAFSDAVTNFSIQIRRISNPANSVTGTGSLCSRVNNGG